MPNSSRGEGKMSKSAYARKTSRKNGSVVPDSSGEEDGGDARTVDSTSVVSSLSYQQQPDHGDAQVDESSMQDLLEDKLKALIDGTSQRSAKGRVECLVALRAAFTNNILTDFLLSRKITMAESLVRCLHKGKSEEQVAASVCAVLLLIQLGPDVEVFNTLYPPIRIILCDGSASMKARCACAEALSLLTFLADEELEVNLEMMSTLERIFKSSYLRDDGTSPTHSPDVSSLHTAAMMSWSLLLTIVPPSTVTRLIDSHLCKLVEVLSSDDVNLRISAGEAIALLYQLERQTDEDFEGTCFTELCASLKQLSTECHKYIAKKDRKQQRSSFRDILGVVEDFSFTSEIIKISREQLSLDCWRVRTQYNALCHILGTGMSIHLQMNELVRDIFGLGRPLMEGVLTSGRACKEDRHFQHGEAFKQRTKYRNSQRDRKCKWTVVAND